MRQDKTNRRDFLRCAATGAGAGAIVPYWFSGRAALAQDSQAKNDRPHIALIGAGGRGRGDLHAAARFGEVVAVCDVDRLQAEHAQQVMGGKPDVYTDYR